MKPLTLALVLAALALTGCLSEINKPIGPNDNWAKQAEMTTAPAAPD